MLAVVGQKTVGVHCYHTVAVVEAEGNCLVRRGMIARVEVDRNGEVGNRERKEEVGRIGLSQMSVAKLQQVVVFAWRGICLVCWRPAWRCCRSHQPFILHKLPLVH